MTAPAVSIAAAALAPGGVLAVFGPTAVGKTDVALALAARLAAAGRHPVAVSADALQVYSGLETLTGVPAPGDRARLEHRLVSFLPVDATFSVGQYAELAHAEIDALLAEGATPIVVGGTGLYLRAALADLELNRCRRRRPATAGPRRWRRRALRRCTSSSYGARRGRPRASTPATAIASCGRTQLLDMGELEPPEGPNRLWTSDTRHPTRLLGLVREREELYRRIDARVEAMVAAGAVDEVRAAHAAGASDTARKALGFDELLAGDVAAMQRRTRNFARRQLTWMRKLPGLELIDMSGRSADDVAAAILSTPAGARP